jgi:YbbR domain-containing protein
MKELFKRNMGVKLLALFSAFVLWVYVAYQNPSSNQVIPQVALEYQGLPKDVAVVEIPKTISLRLQGPRNQDNNITYKDVRAYIDLKDARVGNNILNVQVTIPAGYRIISINPERANVELDVIKEKQVPLQAEFSGNLKPGYIHLGAVLKPDQVLVQGPQTLLAKVEHAYVAADLTDADKHFSHTLPLRLMDANGNNITEKSLQVTPEGVEVFIPVIRKLPTKVVEVKPRLTGKTALGYRVAKVIYNPDVVTISGPEDILNQTGYLETEQINIDGAKQDIVKEVRLLGQKGITWTGKNKISMVVQIEALPLPASSQEVKVELKNIPKGKTASVFPSKIKVVWSQKGEKPLPSMVTVWVDLTGLPSGSHELPVQVLVPQGAKLERVDPVTVQVEIQE